MQRSLLGLMLVAALAAAACTHDSSAPTTPSQQGINLSGTWIGVTPVQGLATPAQMTWTLSQSNSTDVSGPILIGTTEGTIYVNGFLTGTLSGSTLTYLISVGPGGIPLSPTCVGQLGGTMTASISTTTASTLAGDFTLRSSTCTSPVQGGTVTLTKQ